MASRFRNTDAIEDMRNYAPSPSVIPAEWQHAGL
jgi:hypothetical protein